MFRSLPRSLARVALIAFPIVLFARIANAQIPSPTGGSPGGPTSPGPHDDALPGAPAPLPSEPSLDEEPPRPPEPPSARFGAQGQVVIGGGTSLGLSSTQYDASAASYFSAGFSPEVDYFVLKNFSLGLALGINYSDNRGYGADGSVVDTKTTSFSVGPRFGLNIPFGSAVSWWPEATLGFESNHATSTLVSGSSVSTGNSSGALDTRQDGPWVSLYLPLVLHPAPHFFFGAGPSVFHEFAALQGGPNVGDQRTSVGFGVNVGGYWGGTPDPASAPASEGKPRPLTHFGERRDLVFSNELLANVYGTTYAGTPSSAVNGQFTIGTDYFLADHFSFGGGAGAGWSNATGADANGNSVTNSSTSYSFFIRFGAQIPIAGPVSLYPRVTLGVAEVSQDEKSQAGEDSYNYSRIWVGGEIPVIVEVAPHFFVGLGPSASRDLSRNYSFPSGQQASNPSATLGAGAIVGGWL
jgi:hypothetical protein